MKIFDLILMCVRNLTRRKFRTFLTVFGVVIGTTSIVIMISLGVGISESIDRQMESMGDLTLIEVRSQSTDSPLTDDTVIAIETMADVVVASPEMRFEPNSSSMWIYSGRKDRYMMWPNLTGVYQEALVKLGYTTDPGELVLGSDPKKIRIIMGPQVPYQFQDTKKRWPNSYIDGWPDENGNVPDPFFDPMEADYVLRVEPAKDGAKQLTYDIELTGILKLKDNDWSNRYNTFIDIDDLKRIKAQYEKENGIKKEKSDVESYERLQVKVNHIDNVAAVQSEIKAMGYYTSSMEEMRESMQQSTQQIQMILGILGAVALFVAAISITNTMIMSVYERTREIGVMKVLGCLVGNIRTIFLMEAGMIGFIGGMAGIAFSYLLSYLFNTFGGAFAGNMGMGMDGARLSVIPPWLVLTGLVVATSIGLMAGFYPANRAVRISALEAIKQE